MNKNKKQTRTLEIPAQGIDIENRTVQLAFSSETPYKRWFGYEILSHAPEAIVRDRLDNGASLLLNHDWDCQIGVVQEFSVGADGVGRALVRFSKSEKADEIFQDVVDGIRRHVSVGYFPRDMEKTAIIDDDPVYTVTRWEPYEISIVSVPADITVGVGRIAELTEENPKDLPHTAVMTIQTESLRHMPAPTEENPMDRVNTILDIGEKYKEQDLASKAVRDGMPVEEFSKQLLEKINTRNSRPLHDQVRDADIGLTDNQARNFSFMNVVRALANPTDRNAQESARFEFEASRAAAQKSGKNTDNFVIPSDVLTRSLNTSIAGGSAGNTGGYSIARELMTGSFIDILRKKCTIMQLASTLGGLQGNIDIPKQVTASQGYWIGEDVDATQQTLDLGSVSLTPRTCAAYTEITRKLLIQSSLDVEALVRADLAEALALAVDYAAYYGAGTGGSPTGLDHAVGVNAVTFAGTQPTFAEVVAMETAIASSNADVDNMSYVGNAKWRGAMKTAVKFTNTAGTIWEDGGTVNGYKSLITNQIADSHVFFGNFADMILGIWNGLELNVNPYANSKSGRIQIVAFSDVDVAFRRTGSFTLGKPA